MRIALLTALAEHSTRPGQRLAYRRFLGRSVLAHQVDCALAMGCELIVCLARGLGQDIMDCQNRAETAEARFQTIDGNLRLAGLVKADDDLFVFADGLLPDPDIVEARLAERPGILVFPAEVAVPRGFERIDAVRAWAGVLRTRGDRIERLLDLPPDVDAASALLRIALQAGSRTIELDSALVLDGQWDIAGEANADPEREQRWINRHTEPVRFSAPGLAIAERVGVRLSRDIVGTRLERVPLAAGVLFGVLAGAASLTGHPFLGLCLTGVMMLSLPIGAVVERVSRIGARRRHRLPLLRSLRGAADILLAGVLALSSTISGPEWVRLFLPIVLIGLLRLGERIGPSFLRETFTDRILLLAIAIPASFLGFLEPVLAVMTLAILASLFLNRRGPG